MLVLNTAGDFAAFVTLDQHESATHRQLLRHNTSSGSSSSSSSASRKTSYSTRWRRSSTSSCSASANGQSRANVRTCATSSVGTTLFDGIVAVVIHKNSGAVYRTYIVVAQEEYSGAAYAQGSCTTRTTWSSVICVFCGAINENDEIDPKRHTPSPREPQQLTDSRSPRTDSPALSPKLPAKRDLAVGTSLQQNRGEHSSDSEAEPRWRWWIRKGSLWRWTGRCSARRAGGG